MLQIVWHEQAQEAWYEMADYCLTFGKKTLKNFITNIEEWENRIAINPNIAPFEPLLTHRTEGFHSVVIHSHCKLIYYIEDDIIHIADLWDTRREPTYLGLQIRRDG